MLESSIQSGHQSQVPFRIIAQNASSGRGILHTYSMLTPQPMRCVPFTLSNLTLLSDQMYHIAARVHASMVGSSTYIVLIKIVLPSATAGFSVNIGCSCINGRSGYCSHGVAVLEALSSKVPLPVHWSAKPMPLTQAIAAAKKTPPPACDTLAAQ